MGSTVADKSNLLEWPSDLKAWRLYPVAETRETEYNCHFWVSMSPSFASQGVELYKPDFTVPVPFARSPPNPGYCGLPRGARETEPGTYHGRRRMQQKSASVYPAILSDGSDVIVRVVSQGSPPSSQLQILRYLSEETRRADARNHAIPVIQELLFKDWVFIAMPRFSQTPAIGIEHGIWFDTVSEILEFVIQVLEGFAFLHEHLIAHQDIAASNIVVNHVGDITRGYLSRYPCRYYIIDFELAVQFPPSSDPADRVVVGPPIEDFNPVRLAPEMGADAHCPFRADVWQVGMLLLRAFQTQVEPVANLARGMLTRNPEARPTMRECYERICDSRNNLSNQELSSTVERNDFFDSVEREDFPQYLQAFLRGEAIKFENHD